MPLPLVIAGIGSVIGSGVDIHRTGKKVIDTAKKIGGFFKGLFGRKKKKSKGPLSAATPGIVRGGLPLKQAMATSSPVKTSTTSQSSGGGFSQWVKENLFLALAIPVALFLLLSKKKIF